MSAQIEEIEDEEGPLTEGEFEEGLDESEWEGDDEEYDEEADLLDDDGIDNDEPGESEDQEYILGLEPLKDAEAGPDSSRQAAAAAKPWRGLESLPAAKRDQFVKLLTELRNNNKQELTILVLGKYFTGKSLTVNSLLNEDAATRSFIQRESAALAVHSREAHGFTLTFVDVGGLNDADVVSNQRLAAVARALRDKAIDVVLYVDRLDLYRPDGSDEQVLRGITKALGSSVWDNAILGVTYAGETVNGYEWAEFKAKRGERLRQAVRKHGRCPGAELPVAFIENAPSCKKNADGEKVLPDQTAWVPELMREITRVAVSRPAFKHDAKAAERAANPNKKLRWLVPLVFAAQIAFKVLVFDRLVKDDALTGDKSGPFDPSVVRAQRARAAIEKEAARKKAQRKPVQRALAYYSDSDSDSD